MIREEEVVVAGDERTANARLRRIIDRGQYGELVSRIITDIGREIIDGVRRPGEELTSVELGRRFGSSRTPVREALVALEREGLVEMRARRRPRVARMSVREVRELYQVRAALYSTVSELVVREASDEQIGALVPHCETMRAALAADDNAAYFWATVDYRDTEALISGNREVCALIDSLGLRIHRLRRLGLSLPGRMAQSAGDYARLLEAYQERDAELATAITKSMLWRALHAIERSGWEGLEPDGD